MNSKKALIIIICSSQLAGMMTQQKPIIRKKPSINNFFGAPCTFPGSISQDIERKITPEILGKKEWWYLENIIPHERLIYEIGYNIPGTQIIAKSDRLRIFDATTLQQKASFCLAQPVNFTTHSSTPLTTISCHKNVVRLLDTTTHEEIATFCHQDKTYCASYNPKKNQLATGSFDKHLRIFTRYDGYTLDQLALKKLMTTWLMIEKPDKSIASIKTLFAAIASVLNLNYAELLMVWKTFPENMQISLFETIRHKIHTYGKDVVQDKRKRCFTTQTLIAHMIHKCICSTPQHAR